MDNAAAHAKHCFVAIPSGQTSDEKMFYQGWQDEVLVPALNAVGDLTIEISAVSTEPTSITTGIFEHLLFDGLAVFDLAGSTPDALANPNVMYELGIRHAFRKPSVILAWEHQRLPFDVGDQRAVKIDRILYHFKSAREKITQFAKAALHEQKFYDPLAPFKLRAIVEAAATTTDKDALAAITDRMETLADDVGTLQRQVDELSASALRWEPRVASVIPSPPVFTTSSSGPMSPTGGINFPIARQTGGTGAGLLSEIAKLAAQQPDTKIGKLVQQQDKKKGSSGKD
jgi:hypothetical protein